MDNKLGNLGTAVTVSTSDAKITVAAPCDFSKRYLKVWLALWWSEVVPHQEVPQEAADP